ncbi:MAG: pilus assembly protein TadE [Phenylobacterium zucineum]|nr:MAG: pilus assembly protein TadE [Phenylobacterium zucineum]
MLRQFYRDRRGTAAVEFAFVAPIMLLMYFGTAELTQGMMASRRASHVASTVGDLVTQAAYLSQADIDDIFSVGNAIMKPFPTGTLSIRFSSIKSDSVGSLSIACTKHSGSYSDLTSTAGVPNGLLTTNDSIILAEASYTYTSPLQKIIPKPVVFTSSYYLKPRKSAEVVCLP